MVHMTHCHDDHAGRAWFRWFRGYSKSTGNTGPSDKGLVMMVMFRSKWVITPVISGLTLLIPFISGVITHLLNGDEPPSIEPSIFLGIQRTSSGSTDFSGMDHRSGEALVFSLHGLIFRREKRHVWSISEAWGTQIWYPNIRFLVGKHGFWDIFFGTFFKLKPPKNGAGDGDARHVCWLPLLGWWESPFIHQKKILGHSGKTQKDIPIRITVNWCYITENIPILLIDYHVGISPEIPITTSLFLGLSSCWLQVFPVFTRKCSSTCKWMYCYKMFEVIRLISQPRACSSPWLYTLKKLPQTACPSQTKR